MHKRSASRCRERLGAEGAHLRAPTEHTAAAAVMSGAGAAVTAIRLVPSAAVNAIAASPSTSTRGVMLRAIVVHVVHHQLTRSHSTVHAILSSPPFCQAAGRFGRHDPGAAGGGSLHACVPTRPRRRASTKPPHARFPHPSTVCFLNENPRLK
jgi:hypothetical protein